MRRYQAGFIWCPENVRRVSDVGKKMSDWVMYVSYGIRKVSGG